MSSPTGQGHQSVHTLLGLFQTLTTALAARTCHLVWGLKPDWLPGGRFYLRTHLTEIYFLVHNGPSSPTKYTFLPGDTLTFVSGVQPFPNRPGFLQH